jgi:hypothetical protein
MKGTVFTKGLIAIAIGIVTHLAATNTAFAVHQIYCHPPVAWDTMNGKAGNFSETDTTVSWTCAGSNVICVEGTSNGIIVYCSFENNPTPYWDCDMDKRTGQTSKVWVP